MCPLAITGMIGGMEQALLYILLATLGLLMGSFACATVWRLRAHQLQEDRAAGEVVEVKEFQRLKKLLNVSTAEDRSRCLSCGHQLAWYDLLPLVSWLSLGGKCRYCRAPIGWLEPAVELGAALLFVGSYAFWPYPLVTGLDWLQLGLWLAAGVGLVTLFVYDAKWFLLPNRVMFPVIGIAAASAVVRIVMAEQPGVALVDLALAVAVLSGFYWVLYQVSRGTWIGYGDIKLGLALALLLGQWQLALLALFAANVIGCLIVLPGLATRTLDRRAHVPFGPMLIAGWLLAGLVGGQLLQWYMGLILPGF